MKRPAQSDAALAIAVGLDVATYLERRDRVELAVDSALFHAERVRAAGLDEPGPATTVPRTNVLGVALTILTALTLLTMGVVVGLAAPVINGQTLLGGILITAGGALVARLVQVTR